MQLSPESSRNIIPVVDMAKSGFFFQQMCNNGWEMKLLSVVVPISILSCVFGDLDSSSDTYPCRIEGIDNRLEAILTQVGPLNLMRYTLSREEQQEDRANTSSLVQVVYGRDDEKQKIIKRLLFEGEEACIENYGNYSVIPVVGQGGIGKTTLAQSVYNDEQVKAHYDVKAWVCVSDVFDVKQITIAIISSATNKNRKFSDLNQAQEELERLINQKHFLFVLDDVWSDEYGPWEQLQVPFQAGSRGSRVLIQGKQHAYNTPLLLEKVGGECGLLKTLAFTSRKEAYTCNLELETLDSTFQQLQCLRFLCMAGKNIYDLPNSIRNHKHLRFLDLSGNTCLEELPRSMSKLCNLQTLLLEGCLDSSELFDMQALTELRHLNIEVTGMLHEEEMPVGIEKLTNLQTLIPHFFMGRNSGHRICELENLDCLSGSLIITDLQYVKRSEDAKKARLSKKSHLHILEMHWEDARHKGRDIATEVLNQLEPLESLKELELNGYMGLAFPTWAFPCLEELKISSCPLLEGDIPSYLPFLKRLRIVGCDDMKVSLPSCPMLQILKIDTCDELLSIEPVICCSERVFLCDIASFHGVEGFWVQDVETLVAVEGSLKALSTSNRNSIELIDCPKLLSWQPDVYGKLNRLTHVRLRNCNTLATFMERKFPSSVKHLTIEGYNSIKHVSTLTKGSTCLEERYIRDCSSLITVNNLPLTLQVLHIEGVEIEQSAKEWEVHLLTSLKKLEITDAGSCVDSVESISSDSDSLRLPFSLSDITID
ncbi:putative disease resistance protein RGA4, partial [Bienertia sinuspersici]